MFHHIPNWGKILAEVVTGSSILHNALPPYNWDPEFVTVGLSDFPGAQSVFRKIFHNRWYKLLVYVAGFVALNGRSTVWAKWISNKTQMAASHASGVKEGITAGVEAANSVNCEDPK